MPDQNNKKIENQTPEAIPLPEKTVKKVDTKEEKKQNPEKVDNEVKQVSEFEKSSSQNSTSLNEIKEKVAIIDRAQQNISGLTENVIDLKNILSSTSKRGRFGEVLLENLITDHLHSSNYEFQKHQEH